MKVMIVVLCPVGRRVASCPNEIFQALGQRLRSNRFHPNRGALGEVSLGR